MTDRVAHVHAMLHVRQHLWHSPPITHAYLSSKPFYWQLVALLCVCYIIHATCFLCPVIPNRPSSHVNTHLLILTFFTFSSLDVCYVNLYHVYIWYDLKTNSNTAYWKTNSCFQVNVRTFRSELLLTIVSVRTRHWSFLWYLQDANKIYIYIFIKMFYPEVMNHLLEPDRFISIPVPPLDGAPFHSVTTLIRGQF